MIILDEALNIAKEFIENVSKTDGEWQLEEATLEETKKVWSVTYSFWRTADIQSVVPGDTFAELIKLRLNGRRVYRTVKVDAKTGSVIEMKAGFAERQTEAA